MKTLLVPVAVAVFVFGCKDQKTEPEAGIAPEKTEEITEAVPDMHTSQNALDWAGVYAGTLPCADCPGILTSLELRGDHTYLLEGKYEDRGHANFIHEGTFRWDESGSIISLEDLEGWPGRYKVGENRLFHLDMDGNVITGEMAELYVLEKQ